MRHAERVFLVEEDRETTFGELHELANRVAADLRRKGIESGDRVMIVLPNSRWCIAAFFGCWKIGAIVVTANPALTARELGLQLAQSRPRAVIASAARMATVRAADREVGGGVKVWLAEDDMRELPASPPVTPLLVAPAAAAILYTSGTTGVPKGAVLRHDGIYWAQQQWCDVLGLTEDDVVYAGMPLFHSYGLILLMVAAVMAGHRLVLRNGFEFPRVLRLVAEHRVTVLPSVPPVFQAIASLRWDDSAYDFSALRVIVSGAAPITAATIARAQQRLGNPTFLEGYGITETSTLITFGPLGAPVGSVGRALPGVELRLVDGYGKQVATGERGEIWVRTPGLMAGYLDAPDATARAVTDGWYHTGDVGVLDADGNLRVVDRLTDLILVNGENVYPREIEEVIEQFPGVARTAVVRIPFDATGEAPLALVVATDGATICVRDLVAYLRERLAAFKLPRRVELVDAIPTSVSGKVARKELVS